MKRKEKKNRLIYKIAPVTALVLVLLLCASKALKEPVSVSRVSLTDDMRFAGNSKINTGSAILYTNNAGKRGDVVICVNAGHGTEGGGKVMTLAHPDGSPKLTNGSSDAGSIEVISISDGMVFADKTEEAYVTLKEAVLLRDELLSRGYSVLMIREDMDAKLDNVARTVLANAYADCHVSLHWDSTEEDKGAFYIGVPEGLRSMDPVSSVWEESEALGAALIEGLKGRDVRIYKSGRAALDLTQTAYSSIPSVDMELGDKTSDHGDETLALLAKGLADGIDAYFSPEH